MVHQQVDSDMIHFIVTMVTSNIMIILSNGHDFDPQKFYAKLMLADSEDDGDDIDALANRMIGAGYDLNF